MGLITTELLLKRYCRAGGLLRVVLLVCALQIPAVSYAQSIIRPSFYGLTPALKISQEIRSFKPKDILKSPRHQASIDKAARIFQPLAVQIRSLASSRTFSDWMRIQLAMKTVKLLYPNTLDQTIAAAGLMRAMGFNAVLVEFRDSRTGKQGGYGIAVATRQQIFGGVMFEHQNSLYILLDLQKETTRRTINSSMSTLISDSEMASRQPLRPIDLGFSGTPKLPMQPKKITLRWAYNQASYSLPVTVNANLIRYYTTYPQLDIERHLNRPLNREMIKQLVEPLRRMIEKKNFSEKDAVQFLLTFCHDAFNHIDDKKNTGNEHHNFVEETLVAKASDCEDFVLLLSVLIRGSLGYSVIGLEYPNHLSLAVALPDGSVKGEGYRYKGKTYVHCDPSFVGCSLGDVQPDFKNMDPKLVPIGNLLISGN